MSIQEKFKKLFEEDKFPLWGLLGSIILFIALFIPQIGYSGRKGEPYSILNHFVSELGEVGVSHLAIVFNIGLIIGGLCFIPFMYGLGKYIEGPIAKIGMVLGIISAVACSLVGVFPMTILVPHYLAAMTFFLGAMITILVFTIAIAIQKDPSIPKLFIIPGLIVFAIYVRMFTLDFAGIGDNMNLESGDEIGQIINRPDIWVFAIIEWAAVLSVLGYLSLISIYLIITSNK